MQPLKGYFMQSLRYETSDAHKHMVHMFSSVALVSEHYFMDRPEAPEVPLAELKEDHVLLSPEEYALIRNGCVKLVVDIYLPQLQFMQESVQSKNVTQSLRKVH